MLDRRNDGKDSTDHWKIMMNVTEEVSRQEAITQWTKFDIAFKSIVASLISTMLETKRKQENRKISHVLGPSIPGYPLCPFLILYPWLVLYPCLDQGPGLYPWLAPHCPFGEPSPWVRALKLRAPGTCMLPKVLIIL